jgi:hypothetical protein
MPIPMVLIRIATNELSQQSRPGGTGYHVGSQYSPTSPNSSELELKAPLILLGPYCSGYLGLPKLEDRTDTNSDLIEAESHKSRCR